LASPRPISKPLTVFRAELIGSEEASWKEQFAGYPTLKAVTSSSSFEMLLHLADRWPTWKWSSARSPSSQKSVSHSRRRARLSKATGSLMPVRSAAEESRLMEAK